MERPRDGDHSPWDGTCARGGGQSTRRCDEGCDERCDEHAEMGRARGDGTSSRVSCRSRVTCRPRVKREIMRSACTAPHARLHMHGYRMQGFACKASHARLRMYM